MDAVLTKDKSSVYCILVIPQKVAHLSLIKRILLSEDHTLCDRLIFLHTCKHDII